jgi:hypothetical protein
LRSGFQDRGVVNRKCVVSKTSLNPVAVSLFSIVNPTPERARALKSVALIASGTVNFYCRPRTMDSQLPSNFDPKSAVVVCSSCPKEFGWIENTQRLETFEITDIYGQQLSDAVNIHARRQPGVMDLHTLYAMRNQ